MGTPTVVFAIDLKAYDTVNSISKYAVDWVKRFRADIYAVCVANRKTVKNACLADDEFFTVHERKKFITEGCIERAQAVVDALRELCRKQGVRCTGIAGIGDPVLEASKAVRETNAVGVVPFGIPASRLAKKCDAPVILMPYNTRSSLYSMIIDRMPVKSLLSAALLR